MNKPAVIALIIFIASGPAAGALQDPWSTWNTPAEVRELLLNAAARERLGSEYENLVWRGRLTRGQQIDFVNFLGELDFRIAKQCRKLGRQNPDKDLNQLPCPRGGAGSAPDLASIDVESERTPEESVAALDAELASGLGEYDEMLLEEQKKIASRTPARSQSSAWGGRSESEAGEMQGSAGDSQGESGSEAGDSAAETSEGEYGAQGDGEYGEEQESRKTGGEMTSRRRQSSRSSAGDAKDAKREPPDDIPDGSDDDVVARQIREAAEKETDPRLRKKLWEEYRRYKTARR